MMKGEVDPILEACRDIEKLTRKARDSSQAEGDGDLAAVLGGIRRRARELRRIIKTE